MPGLCVAFLDALRQKVFLSLSAPTFPLQLLIMMLPPNYTQEDESLGISLHACYLSSLGEIQSSVTW